MARKYLGMKSTKKGEGGNEKKQTNALRKEAWTGEEEDIAAVPEPELAGPKGTEVVPPKRGKEKRKRKGARRSGNITIGRLLK